MRLFAWIDRNLGAVLGAAFLIASLGTCAHAPTVKPPSAPLPVYITTFTPPEDYRRWYHQAERCAGMTGNFDGVRWGVVPTPWGDTTYAQWSYTRDAEGFVRHVDIVVNARMWRDSLLVIHESLHDILWRNGWKAPDLPATASTRDSLINLHPRPFRVTGPLGICPAIFYPWPKDSA